MNEKNSRKYGSFADLSTRTEKSITKVIEKLDEKQITYNIYYGYPVIDEKQNKDYVKGIIISVKGIFVLFENEKEQDRYVSRVTQLLTQDTDLYSLIRKLNYIEEINLNNADGIVDIYEASESVFDDSIIEKANRAIQTAYGLSKIDDREVTSPDSLGTKLKSRNTYIGTFDEDQFNMIHAYDNNNLRIRGLAGSGKTILLVKKMAYLHYKYPEKNLVFVFFTISLKQYIFELFKKYYRDYDRYGDPNMNKIEFLHGWGSAGRMGFYSHVCSKVGFTPKNFNDAIASKTKGEDAFEYVCRDLHEYIDDKKIESNFYDYIFIDEAQDFKIEFFKLARKTLSLTGNLIYAYDELQSLNDESSMPKKSEIFGEQECIDINLTRSYRAPLEILVTAHALGLGMYREVEKDEIPFVNILRDTEVWSDIGYHVIDGRLAYGEHVVLARSESKLPNEKIITTIGCYNEEQQYRELSDILINLMKNEDVIPEDILIIDLSYKIADNHTKFRTIFNSKARAANLILPGSEQLAASINLVNKDNPTRMKMKNAIPYTTIFRAKGNEANLIFIVNADSLEMMKSISRNKLFTAMTRARYAVWLMGMGQVKSFEKEILEVEAKNFTLDFTYPTEAELDRIKTYGEQETVNERKVSNVVNDISSISKTNPELAKKLLLDMLSQLGDE
ncbi:DEAD/DEAH box helicase [Paenibacillus sp. FSL H7-0714]|uniref:DEAD/DEAH box helicase n=1 Tax=Paenibacillus sp. FSL H7-0714 TaxID=2954735 RepID=UPI0030F80DE3